MEYDEAGRSEIEAILREKLNTLGTVGANAVLVSGIVISEWILPDGSRFLARTPIGQLAPWQTQGYLFSTLFEQDWEHIDEDDSLNDDDDEEEASEV